MTAFTAPLMPLTDRSTYQPPVFVPCVLGADHEGHARVPAVSHAHSHGAAAAQDLQDLSCARGEDAIDLL